MPWQEENQAKAGRNFGIKWEDYALHGKYFVKDLRSISTSCHCHDCSTTWFYVSNSVQANKIELHEQNIKMTEGT